MTRVSPFEFKRQLEERTRNFAVSTFRLLDGLPKTSSTMVISYQLGKSASSVGANYREANRSESRDDFKHKLQVSLKEASESVYWYEVLGELYPMNPTIRVLGEEVVELRNLFQSISASTARNSKILKSPNH